MPLDSTIIRDNVARAKNKSAEAAARSGRSASAVTIVAATKTQSLEAALAALNAGITHFGENRVQEAIEKWGGHDRSDITLHMIGHLQRNKGRHAANLFDVVQSVDSVALARKLSSSVQPRTLRILLEVNIGTEPSKTGFTEQQLHDNLPDLLEIPCLAVEGLMTVAPRVAASEQARPYFARMRILGEHLQAAYPSLGGELSMGMTDDFEVAIEEGATMVRLGRVLFGERA